MLLIYNTIFLPFFGGSHGSCHCVTEWESMTKPKSQKKTAREILTPVLFSVSCAASVSAYPESTNAPRDTNEHEDTNAHTENFFM